MRNGINFETWHEHFNRFAGDLYPGRYTAGYVRDLVEVGQRVRALAEEKGSVIVAHNYQYPELQEVAEEVGDSLGLSQYVAAKEPQRVDFCGVWFMGETAKTILGKRSKVFMPDRPGCSLVASIDHGRIGNWISHNPDGIIVSYINTDARTKALSHYICTSRNAPQILQHAAEKHPGQRILFLPDKYLGAVSLAQTGIDASLVDLYDGACHVHAKIGEHALEGAFDRHPEADLLIHPRVRLFVLLFGENHRRGFPLSEGVLSLHGRHAASRRNGARQGVHRRHGNGDALSPAQGDPGKDIPPRFA